MRRRRVRDGPRETSYERLTGREFVCAAALGAAGLALLGWLFYRSLWAVLLLQGFLPAVIAFLRREITERRRGALLLAFRDAAESLGAALSAGYSVENAFRAALADLRTLYPEDSPIVREFAAIAADTPHAGAEEGLARFAARSGIREAEHLAQVLITGRRTGGNLPAILAATAEGIEDKIELKRELSLLVAAKKLESRIMCLLPCLMIVYLQLCSPGFLAPLYEGLFGRLVMSLLLAVYGAAVWLSERIAGAATAGS